MQNPEMSLDATSVRASLDIRRLDHWFFTSMALVTLSVVVTGFGRNFFFAPFSAARPLRPLLLVHASVFTAWMLLFVLQTSLIWARRPHIHRRMGLLALFLLPAMLVLGTLTVVEAASGQPPVPAAINLFGSMAVLVLFVALVGGALWHRGSPELHKRLMLVAALTLASAGLGRFLPQLHLPAGAEMVLTLLYYFAWVGYDGLTRARIWVTPLVGAAIAALITPVGIPLIARSDPWVTFTAFVLHGV